MNKEPDKYKCIKTTLTSICSSEFIENIQDSVIRTNRIIIKTYLLLRLWILSKYHSNQQIYQFIL